jgi:hypothetical protein
MKLNGLAVSFKMKKGFQLHGGFVQNSLAGDALLVSG